MSEPRKCKRCGKDLPPKRSGRGRPRKYCSRRCLDKAKNQRFAAENPDYWLNRRAKKKLAEAKDST